MTIAGGRMSPPEVWAVRRVLHPDAPLLADLVDDEARFRADAVYRHPLVSRAATTGRDVARFGDVDALWADLLGRGARRPAFRLVNEGTTAAPAAVTRRARIGDRDLDDVIAPNRVVDGYRSGCTVVLQGLHLTDPGIARLANNLALELDQPVQVNAYLTPESARGLDVHFDYHDVFVVQLEGSKRWRIWEPLDRFRLPVAGKHRVPKPTFDELPDEPVLDITLRSGDVLYLPRGFPHAAETTDEASAHLTIGLLALTWQRVVRRAIDAEVAAGRLNESIPLGTLDPEAPASPPPDTGRLAPDVTSAAVRRWVANEIWSRQATTRLRPLRRRTFDDDARFAFTPGPLISLTRQGAHSLLGLGDRLLRLPVEAERFLIALLAAPATFTLAELAAAEAEAATAPSAADPGADDATSGLLDAASQRVVVERLVDEGVLALAGQEAAP